MSDQSARLLFVCVENSCRSQIAEGFTATLEMDATKEPRR
jgi:protein-tyrosine-phosphatase